MRRIHKIDMKPNSRKENIVIGDQYRITVLTAGLIRLEFNPDNRFEDSATQTVLNRDFEPVEYRVIDREGELQIHTSRIHLTYNKKEFSDFGLSIKVKGNISLYHSIWKFGESFDDLKGTARTLDEVNGACPLESGLLSRNGFSVMDDSSSLLLQEDGWVKPRKKGIQDIYFFGYGHDYLECLRDFFRLCGQQPMLPRFALGNWWSRFYPYTEDTYKELMERFEEEQIPLSVAVIDMDWHLTEIEEKYGNGWTGYTWNKELFPNPARFLDWLHERGLKTTLNVHPAEGLRAYEDNYKEMAEALGVNSEMGDPVDFDISNPDFLEAYFKYMHHPHEEMGVDFWWIDWQQGGKSKVEGLDPLWMLNHYHYLDNSRNGRRPLILSRYAGPGSHRYPVGFSGDTITTWESLEFQPYFTSTASNIGYSWWSHDIGGHMKGSRDDEMAARWVQFGVFSPINRLHSSSEMFSGKEPWRYSMEAKQVMKVFMRMRHKMLPYLYTMNHRAWQDGKPMIQPMYYQHQDAEAYTVKNQYYFGSELIVHPVTSPRLPGLNAARVKTWLPEGIYFDIFTDVAYQGGRFIDMYRTLESIPVLAKAGAILPMTNEIFGKESLANPESLTVHVYAGADNTFCLYEDDNETNQYQNDEAVITKMTFNWTKEKGFCIHPAQGDIRLIPAKRDYEVCIHGITEASAEVLVNGQKIEAGLSYHKKEHCLYARVQGICPADKVEFQMDSAASIAGNDIEAILFPVLEQMKTSLALKEQIFALIQKQPNRLYLVEELKALVEDSDLLGWLYEVITAY